MKLWCVFFLTFINSIYALDYQKLSIYQNQDAEKLWQREIDPNIKPAPVTESISVEMKDYYEEIKADKKVTVYWGLGKDGYYKARLTELKNMILELAKQDQRKLSVTKFQEDKILILEDQKSKVSFEILAGHERNEFYQSFKDYEVVMYHGHSRYGRGPAFGEYENYFRIGENFQTIEVGTQNPYFLNEEVLLSETYPLNAVKFGEVQDWFQYRGQKLESSHLKEDSYTINIEGNGRDFKDAEFYEGKQIIFFYSCSNVHYWKKPFRDRFDDLQEKIVFGTDIEGHWGTSPTATLIYSLIVERNNSKEIVDELDATGDCGENCFVSY